VTQKPELLAPAGDAAALAAALASGADAVYFGLDDGFNARARAANFSLETLPSTVARIHRAGARAYLTLNTLVFEPELPIVEDVVRKVAAAGVDAIIVQDPAVALLARAICPALEVHGSTQMTVSSAEGAAFAAGLGVTRVVAPRELSVDELRALTKGTSLELEVFVHGALCVSWSGQCLTSEAWGGRSANRGQCAQSCRMPYDLIVDGQARDLGDVKYLLSPRDLAGAEALAGLVELGVHGLKIEGRQKNAQYVATAVGGYRRWLDAILAGRADRADAQARLASDLADMTLSYSRGFGGGFLTGTDHQTLVDGRFPKHRGVALGQVTRVAGDDVFVASSVDDADPIAAPRPGMGVVFDAGHPEDKEEPGGPLYRVTRRGREWILGFGRPGPDLARVAPGQRVWITSDPSLGRAAEKLIAGAEPEGRIPCALVVSGAAGEPLRVRAAAIACGHEIHVEATSESLLAPARGGGIDHDLLAAKIGAFGGTPLALTTIDHSSLGAGLHLPVSELKDLRRRLVADLVTRIERGPAREISTTSAISSLRAPSSTPAAATPQLIPLCRTDAQLEAVIAAGLPEVELDWMELVGLGRAVTRAREAGLRVTIATVRVQKPGEEGVDTRIARLAPDAVLVRHWGAVMWFARARADRPPVAVHGDFSLNVTNSITARHLLSLGVDSLTAAHDLDSAQLFALLDHVPPDRLTVAVHHHIPTFHTEHCVYSHLLSSGRDHRTCGRPCEQHELALRDRVDLVHPVVVDVNCRNTVFNAQAQSAAALVPRLLARGVRRFRIELVRESQSESAAVLSAYTDLLAGRIRAPELCRRVGVHEQFGVTRGTMKILGDGV
jgi:putative protease